MPNASRVSRDLFAEIPIVREPIPFKELGGLVVINELPDFLFGSMPDDI